MKTLRRLVFLALLGSIAASTGCGFLAEAFLNGLVDDLYQRQFPDGRDEGGLTRAEKRARFEEQSIRFALEPVDCPLCNSLVRYSHRKRRDSQLYYFAKRRNFNFLCFRRLCDFYLFPASSQIRFFPYSVCTRNAHQAYCRNVRSSAGGLLFPF